MRKAKTETDENGGDGEGSGGDGIGAGGSARQKWEKVCKPAEFPKALSPSEQLSAWISWKRQFMIAMEMMRVRGQAQRAQLSYLYIGDELRLVIDAYKMMPDGSLVDGRFEHCVELIKKLDDYFRSATDETIDLETLWAAKQRSTDSARVFLTRIMQQAERCGITDMKIIRTNFLRGMKDQAVALTAIAGEWDVDKIVKAATRNEALNPGGQRPFGEAKSEPIEVFAVGTGERSRRDSWQSRGRGRWQNRYQGNSRGNNRFSGSGRGAQRGSKQCTACGLQSHRFGSCPAIGKPCLTCTKIGHFSAVCKASVNALQDMGDRDHEVKIFE